MKIKRPIASIHQTAKNRPPHYLETIMKLGEIEGDNIVFSPENYLQLVQEFSPEKYRQIDRQLQRAKPQYEWPFFLRPFKLLAAPSDKGLGDIVVRIIGPDNSQAFQTWFQQKFRRPCGCEDRHAWLNQKFPLA